MAQTEQIGEKGGRGKAAEGGGKGNAKAKGKGKAAEGGGKADEIMMDILFGVLRLMIHKARWSAQFCYALIRAP